MWSTKIIKKLWQPLILAIIVCFSIIFGWGASHAIKPPEIALNVKAVDKATGNFTIGEDLYVKSCGTCHIPIPPAVLPSKTWETILENPTDHYGVKLEGFIRFNQRLMWQYLQNYSRLLLKDESEPKFIAQSRYFYALHPDVEFTSDITHTSCLECHSRARDFDYTVDQENISSKLLNFKF